MKGEAMAFRIGRIKYSLILFLIASLLILMNSGSGLSAKEPFNKDHWEKIRNKNNYTDDPVETRPVTNRQPLILPQFIQTIIIVVTVLLLIFITLRIVLRHFGRYGKIKPSDNIKYYDADDESLTYDMLYSRFAEARSQGDYRLAIRYLYIMLLQHLDSINLIELKRGKTNKQYCMELGSKTNDYNLPEITNEYEAVWFGDMIISENRFIKIAEQNSWLTTNPINKPDKL